jgi:hypothetical protein
LALLDRVGGASALEVNTEETFERSSASIERPVWCAQRGNGQSAQSMTLPQVTSPMASALPLGEKAMETG